MKLFLDDSREFPKNGYECVRDTQTAKLLLSIMEFEFVTFDYSLGEADDTGLDVLVWMKENNIVVPHINIHSSHVVGRRMMREFCEKNFPNSKITTNMLMK